MSDSSNHKSASPTEKEKQAICLDSSESDEDNQMDETKDTNLLQKSMV